MAKEIFIGRPNMGTARKTKPRVHQTKFGDGYELRMADGINHKPRTWPLVFSGNFEEHTTQLDFIEECGGVTSFQWLDPRGETKTYVCREWESEQVEFGVYELRCDFEQVFDL